MQLSARAWLNCVLLSRHSLQLRKSAIDGAHDFLSRRLAPFAEEQNFFRSPHPKKRLVDGARENFIAASNPDQRDAWIAPEMRRRLGNFFWKIIRPALDLRLREKRTCDRRKNTAVAMRWRFAARAIDTAHRTGDKSHVAPHHSAADETSTLIDGSHEFTLVCDSKIRLAVDILHKPGNRIAAIIYRQLPNPLRHLNLCERWMKCFHFFKRVQPVFGDPSRSRAGLNTHLRRNTLSSLRNLSIFVPRKRRPAYTSERYA